MTRRAKKTAKFVRETEAPSPMVIELDDESDTIASRVKDMVRLRKKRRKKETPSVMVIESDDDSDSIASRVKNMARLRRKQRKKEAPRAMVTYGSTTKRRSPVDEMSSDSEERRPNLKWAKKEGGQGFNRSPTVQCEE